MWETKVPSTKYIKIHQNLNYFPVRRSNKQRLRWKFEWVDEVREVEMLTMFPHTLMMSAELMNWLKKEEKHQIIMNIEIERMKK